jgi:hypothetical protein
VGDLDGISTTPPGCGRRVPARSHVPAASSPVVARPMGKHTAAAPPGHRSARSLGPATSRPLHTLGDPAAHVAGSGRCPSAERLSAGPCVRPPRPHRRVLSQLGRPGDSVDSSPMGDGTSSRGDSLGLAGLGRSAGAFIARGRHVREGPRALDAGAWGTGGPCAGRRASKNVPRSGVPSVGRRGQSCRSSGVRSDGPAADQAHGHAGLQKSETCRQTHALTCTLGLALPAPECQRRSRLLGRPGARCSARTCGRVAWPPSDQRWFRIRGMGTRMCQHLCVGCHAVVIFSTARCSSLEVCRLAGSRPGGGRGTVKRRTGGGTTCTTM